MATVITSIGSKSTTGNPVNGALTMSGSSGSGTPWSGTVSFTSSPTANIGDMLFFDDVYYNCMGSPGSCTGPADIIYLITGVSGSTLTVKYISGGANVDPIQLYASNNPSGSKAQPYVLRFYSTPATWDVGLDDDDLYVDGDTAKGECYDDSDFDIGSNVTIDGGGSLSGGSLDTVILSVAAGERHNGTAKEVSGSGVRFLFSGAYAFYINEARDAWVEWIDFDANDQQIKNVGVLNLSGGQWAGQYENGAQACLVHDNLGQTSVGGNDHTFGLRCSGAGKFVCNCIVYNMSNQGQEDCYGLYTDNQDRVIVTNCTVYNIHGFDNTPALSDARGLWTSSTANAQYRNNISARVYGSASNLCFGTNAGADNNNLSTDDTADGTNCIADVDYTTLFFSTVDGAEDLHLKNGSPALRAGEDLGTQRTIGGATVPPIADLMNVDIDGRDRDAEGDTWDIGADQCDTCYTYNFAPAFLLFLDT